MVNTLVETRNSGPGAATNKLFDSFDYFLFLQKKKRWNSLEGGFQPVNLLFSQDILCDN